MYDDLHAQMHYYRAQQIHVVANPLVIVKDIFYLNTEISSNMTFGVFQWAKTDQNLTVKSFYKECVNIS